MSINTFIDKVFTFLGIQQQPPRNDFRNPIWGDDDEDDGEELYDNHAQFQAFQQPNNLHHEITRQMVEMLKSFGSLIGETMPNLQEEQFRNFNNECNVTDFPENEYHNSNLRDYYLKPGYHQQNPKEDIDLDGKISSQDISGLLKRKTDNETNTPFDGNIVPGRSFCQTIITTSITKPDGTIETKRIIKNRNGVTEETTTKTGPDERSPMNLGVAPSHYYNNIITDFTNRWRYFY